MVRPHTTPFLTALAWRGGCLWAPPERNTPELGRGGTPTDSQTLIYSHGALQGPQPCVSGAQGSPSVGLQGQARLSDHVGTSKVKAVTNPFVPAAKKS